MQIGDSLQHTYHSQAYLPGERQLHIRSRAIRLSLRIVIAFQYRFLSRLEHRFRRTSTNRL